MKVSIRASMRPSPAGDVHPLQWAFEQGSKLGFDGLELCIGADRRTFVTAWTDQLRQEARALSEKYNMPIYSLSSDWAWAFATFFPELKDWSKGVQWLAEDARLAKDLGAHTILMHFATARGPWEDCKALIADAAAAAQEQGVVFGYEANIWNLIDLGGFEGLLRMTDEVANPHFGVYLHNDYPRSGLPLQEEIERTGKRLVQAMHSSSLISGPVQIDFAKAFRAMQTSFPDGAYTFEVPWEAAEQNKKVIDEMIAKYW